MPTYEYLCECGEYFTRTRLVSECSLPSECPSCSCVAEKIYLTPPEVVDTMKELPFTRPGVNLARGVRTPAQQERLYAKDIEAAKLDRRRRRRSSGDVRLTDSEDMAINCKIPREMYIARTRQYGKDYWWNEGKKALKRDGLVD